MRRIPSWANLVLVSVIIFGMTINTANACRFVHWMRGRGTVSCGPVMPSHAVCMTPSYVEVCPVVVCPPECSWEDIRGGMVTEASSPDSADMTPTPADTRPELSPADAPDSTADSTADRVPDSPTELSPLDAAPTFEDLSPLPVVEPAAAEVEQADPSADAFPQDDLTKDADATSSVPSNEANAAPQDFPPFEETPADVNRADMPDFPTAPSVDDLPAFDAPAGQEPEADDLTPFDEPTPATDDFPPIDAPPIKEQRPERDFPAFSEPGTEQAVDEAPISESPALDSGEDDFPAFDEVGDQPAATDDLPFGEPVSEQPMPADDFPAFDEPAAAATEQPAADDFPSFGDPAATEEPAADDEFPAFDEPAAAATEQTAPDDFPAFGDPAATEEPAADDFPAFGEPAAPEEPAADDFPAFGEPAAPEEPAADDFPAFGEPEPAATEQPAPDDFPAFGDPAAPEEPAADEFPAFDEPLPAANEQPAPDDFPAFGDPAATEEPAADDFPAFDEPVATEEPGTDDFPAFDEPAATEQPAAGDDFPAFDSAPEQPVAASQAPRKGMRVWTDNTGTFRTLGRLAVISRTEVRLLKDNGRYCTVPLTRLSDRDIDYVFAIAQKLNTSAQQIASR